ncbi:MAG: lipopolysaccharide heptosyltransferase II [Deltaproteobacteria bacterium]|nr:lipopolysaccharide heptosyltransferase II [Deltaproteobacteria bacterium]
MGDTIISFPAIRCLRTIFPQAHIYVLARSHLAELWRANPDVDEVIPYDMPKGVRRIFAELKIARLLMGRRIDLAVVLPSSFSSAWMVFLGGIPYRIGYVGEARDWLLTERVRRNPELLSKHRMYYYLNLIKNLGHFISPPLPSLSLNGKIEKWANDFLSQNGLREKLLIGFNAGATYGEAKCWPLERFVELGGRLIKDYGASILIFGSPNPKEMMLNTAIAQGIGEGCLNLAGETSLLQLASLLRHCRLLVTNDTGTMHVGAAVGTRVVAIFGPTDPRTTSPLGDGHIVVRRDVPCSPCLKRVCPEDHQCMELIKVDDVYKVVEAKLKEGPSSVEG